MIDGKTEIYGLLGRPVAHSLSPAMHNAAFAATGRNAVYVAFPVTDLEDAVAGIRGLGIQGVSVTIPFKEDIIPLLDALDEKADRIGAVNTVQRWGERLAGYNTDWVGAVAALEQHTALKGQQVLLLGAGGAARAIVFGILEQGGRVTVTDLDAARAAGLARDLGIDAVPLADLGDCRADILINATPVGMAPDTDGIPLDPELLGCFALVMDIVYRPLKTRLLKEAGARGCRTIDGLQMLIHQATAQFELWTGLKAPAAVMSQAAYAALGEEAEEFGGGG